MKTLTIATLKSLIKNLPDDATVMTGDSSHTELEVVAVYYNKTNSVLYLEADRHDVCESQNIIWPSK